MGKEGLVTAQMSVPSAPAIGVLLRPSKDDKVVKHSLSRTASPALIAQYETHLPDK